MSEKNKIMRLSKISKEFNVGISTIVEFLAKKGHTIESNPNTKIDGELYETLAQEFQAERKVKEKADQIDLTVEKAEEVVEVVAVPETIVVAPVEAPVLEAPAVPEVSKAKKPAKPRATAKKEPAKPKETTTPVVEEKEEVVAKGEPTVEVQDEQPIVEAKKTPKETLVSTPQEEVVQSVETTTDQPSSPDETSGAAVKIIGKIDISDLNTKTRPDKKTKAEKEKQKLEEKKAREQAKIDREQKLQASQKEGSIANKIATPEVKEVASEEQQPAAESEEKQENKFIETQYVKLSGPKILEEKIDLSQFNRVKKPTEKPTVGDDNKKRKRKRITKEAVDISSATQRGEKKNVTKPQKDRIKKELKKPEIDGQAIEKQIKDTLARLAPSGKSKTSKHRREKRQNISQSIQDEMQRDVENLKTLKITEFVTANELATMMNVPVNKVIAACMSLGMLVSINQRLDAEAIQLICDEFGYNIEFVSAEVVEALVEEEEDRPEDLEPRSPIVTVMGHVDHGKTSLLDYIRKANVIAGEAGGITQHIGAYEVKVGEGKTITFLDTPGHEAFTAMRARGAKVTDIVIVVIACDDSVMPQTIEAINHAQAAGCPIIFAFNKIDKPGANSDKIREELSQMNILVEEWGGKYQTQEISAKQGLHVDLLLEKVLLEAEMLDLKGNPHKRARGTIIESSLDKGRGYVVKLLVQDGTISQGDIVLAGTTHGRVKAMYNERNQVIKEAGPSTPLLLLGLNGAPQAGDLFNVMASEKEAKDLSTRRTQLQREQGLRTQKHITLDEIGRRIAIGDFKQLNLIVKGDVDGSVEALSDSLLKLSTEEVEVNVIHKTVGQITESDVLLATASNAIIIGFQVRPSVGARKLAEAEEIDIRLYSIIYTAINEIKNAIEGMLSPEIEEKIVANLEIRETFKINKVGTIAGCFCLDGKINRNTDVRIIRDGIVVYTGKLASLRRFKDDVKEVVSGQDCGLNIENFNDIKVGDIVEGFDQIEIKRKL